MASFDGRSLGDLSRSGAVLFLRSPSQITTSVSFEAGGEVEFALGSRAVILSDLRGDRADEIVTDAFERLNRACDIIASRGYRGGVASDPIEEHVVWWHEEEKTVLRLWSAWTTTGTFRAGSPATLSSQGWHESLRYFRMSEETDDLFDAFRNVYLGIESALSTLVPVQLKPNGRPSEGEGAWLKRALTVLSGSLDLRAYAPGQDPDPVEDVFDDLYGRVRTAVFHAKTNRPVALPLDLANRGLVSSAKVRYTRLLGDLMRVALGLQFQWGGMTREFLDEAIKEIIGKWQLFVTSDSSPATSDDMRISPRDERVEVVAAGRAPGLDQGRWFAVAGRLSIEDMRGLEVIGRFGALNGDGDLAGVEFLGVLGLDGIDEIEVAIAARQLNGNQPRSAYLT